jgi:YhcH/YjgK/YiaL family protein
MILDRLDNGPRYLALHPGFNDAFEFLTRSDLTALEEGRHDISRNRVYALVMQADGKPRDEALLEAHRKYIDIQVAVDGADVIGWTPIHECTKSRGFDADKDLEFFDDPVASWVRVPAGCFAIFFPKDVHAPCAFEGTIRKVVVKVAVEM